MSLRALKWITIFLPPFLIGGFEYIRHDFMTGYLSMEAGNGYMVILTFILSYFFATWMFRTIDRTQKRLSEEQAKRAVFEERERMALELHDNIAQMLFFLNVKLKQSHMEEAKSVLVEIDSYLRQAIFNLRTSPLEGTDLKDRLHKWLTDWSKVSGIQVDQDIQLQQGYYSQTEEVQLFGIIQESFTNIRKHSSASNASIVLNTFPGEWLLTITDNGIGIENDDRMDSKYGISIMRKRANELGASFEISKLKSGGAKVLLHAQRSTVQRGSGL